MGLIVLSYSHKSTQKQHKSQKVTIMTYIHTPREKEAMIQKWYESIEKLKQQIEKLKEDKNLSVAERQKKIAKRLDIIDGYEFSIKQAKEYLKREDIKLRDMYARLNEKTK